MKRVFCAAALVGLSIRRSLSLSLSLPLPLPLPEPLSSALVGLNMCRSVSAGEEEQGKEALFSLSLFSLSRQYLSPSLLSPSLSLPLSQTRSRGRRPCAEQRGPVPIPSRPVGMSESLCRVVRIAGSNEGDCACLRSWASISAAVSPPSHSLSIHISLRPGSQAPCTPLAAGPGGRALDPSPPWILIPNRYSFARRPPPAAREQTVT